MQCHKCRYDERNGGTLEERKLHCPKCELSEVYVKPGFPVGDSLTDALIEKESMFRYDHQDRQDRQDHNNHDDHGGHGEHGDYGDEGDGIDAEIEIMANSEWVRRFPKLGWREQQIVLLLLNGKGNKAIHDCTGWATSTVVHHRHLLAQDEYWGKWLDRISARQRTRRKRTKKPGPMRAHDCNGVFRDRRDRDRNRDGGEAACVP